MDFGHRAVRDEGLDQHSRFTLSDKWGGGCHHGLCARDAHGPEEEDGEFPDGPLQDTGIVEELDEGDEKDDGRDDRD